MDERRRVILNCLPEGLIKEIKERGLYLDIWCYSPEELRDLLTSKEFIKIILNHSIQLQGDHLGHRG